MKSALGGLISRLDITEERISEFENMLIETFKSEKKKKKTKNLEQDIQHVWDTYTSWNIDLMKILKRENEQKKYLEWSLFVSKANHSISQ